MSGLRNLLPPNFVDGRVLHLAHASALRKQKTKCLKYAENMRRAVLDFRDRGSGKV